MSLSGGKLIHQRSMMGTQGQYVVGLSSFKPYNMVIEVYSMDLGIKMSIFSKRPVSSYISVIISAIAMGLLEMPFQPVIPSR